MPSTQPALSPPSASPQNVVPQNTVSPAQPASSTLPAVPPTAQAKDSDEPKD
jgi:hypothetical protein